MKALVISGGGSKGAFAGGVVQYLISEQKQSYDLFVGTSTGSMIVPMAAAGDIRGLKEGYTTISQDDIFTVNPFKLRKDGTYGINLFAVGYNLFIRRQKTFGDSSKVSGLIRRLFTKYNYESVIKTQKDVLICVTNLSLECKEYKSIKDLGYEDFCDFMQASGSMTPFMSIINKDGNDYADGGMIDPVPIQMAIDRGATEIDAIVLRPEFYEPEHQKVDNAFQLLSRIFGIMLDELGRDDVAIGKLLAGEKTVTLRIHYTPYRLIDNPLIFDQDLMNTWWELGYQYAKGLHCKVYKIEHGRPPRQIII